MDRNKHDIEVLKEFLGFPINNSDNVFDKFLQIPNNIYHADPEKNERRFIYIPGSRQNKVVLVAHADTICKNNDSRVEFYEENDFFYGKDNSFLPADDRAGCAILWLLKDSGHSLLITDGEEDGKIGANYIKD